METLKILYGYEFGFYFKNIYEHYEKMGQELLNPYHDVPASAHPV